VTAVVVAGAVVLLAALAAARWMPRGTGGVVSQVDSFAAARAVTNRWSADPTSTPQPLRDYLSGQQQQDEPPPAEPDAG
jgi:hypothetical protein